MMKILITWIVLVMQFAAPCHASGIDDYRQDRHFFEKLNPAEKEWLEKHEPLTYVYDPDWAPFEWKTDEGTHTGIIADLYALLIKKTGLKLIPRSTDTWSEAVSLVRKGEADMFSAITVTEERTQYLDFTTRDIYSYPAVLVTQFDDNEIYLELEKDARLKTIAIVKDSGLGAYIQKSHPGLNYLEVSSTQAGFKSVIEGDADLFAINAISARYFIELRYKDEIKIATKLDYIYNLKIAVRKDKPPEVISILDKALNSISDTEQTVIFNRWTSVKEVAATDWGIIAKVSSVFIIIFMLLGWHNIKLKKLVNQKTKELNDLAHTDSLTGANNRRKLDTDFIHEVKRANRNRHKMALLFLDLNNFKTVNDTYGHEFGDLVLKNVASRVTGSLRGTEQLYRVGGDEFCILLPEIASKDQVLRFADRLRELIADINSINNNTIDIGSSIGLSIYPEDGESLDALMTTADRDMYQEKAGKK